MSKKLRILVVGVKGMGAQHARILAQLPEYELAGICDLDSAVAHAVADPLSVPVWESLSTAIRDTNAEVVSVCTPNASHAALTMEAARAGVRAVNCEKPMAVNLGDARRMADVCRQENVALIVNHQRRLSPDLLRARELITSGAIGELVRLEGYCAGDFLSDGTHAVDSLFWLAGDVPALSVSATIDLPPLSAENPQGSGTRYGHAVEKGMESRITLQNGLEVHLATGSRADRKAYQEYLVIGTKGRLWRVGDRHQPNLFLEQTGKAGTHAEAFDSKLWYSYPVADSGKDETWTVVDLPKPGPGGSIGESYRRLHACLAGTGPDHPLRAEIALRNFEVVMAVYEAARLGQTIHLPLQQERFPLDLILEEQTKNAS